MSLNGLLTPLVSVVEGDRASYAGYENSGNADDVHADAAPAQ